jgi:AraC-like DNA-binding protein
MDESELRLARAPLVEEIPFREDESEYSPRSPFSAHEKRIAGEHRVRLHYHENLEINVFSRCRGEAVVNGKVYDAARTKVLVLPPRSPHSYKLSATAGKVLVVHISFEALAFYLDAERILGRPLDSRHIAVSDNAYAALESPCRALFAAKGGDIAETVYRVSEIVAVLDKVPDPGSALSGGGAIASLRQAGGRSAAAEPSGAAARDARVTVRGAAAEERLLELIAFTEKSCPSRISLDEAARVAGLSRGRFCRWFKACAGLTYFDYLEAVRLDRAKLLLDSGASVTEACFESGFGNLSYFIKRFRLREGSSPGAYGRARRPTALA